MEWGNTTVVTLKEVVVQARQIPSPLHNNMNLKSQTWGAEDGRIEYRGVAGGEVGDRSTNAFLFP